MSVCSRIATVLTFSIVFLSAAFAQGNGQNFRVLKAEYGADNRWLDVTDRVQNLVRGEGVAFRVDGDTLTDPLPGMQKTLRVRYVYGGRTRTDNFPDLADVRLGNPGGRSANARGNGNSSIFGDGNNANNNNNDNNNNNGNRDGSRGGGARNGNNDGDRNANARARDFSIVRAEYGQGTRWQDVTELLTREIRSGTLRMDVNNNTMGGDPAPAVVKVLRVQYNYRGQPRTVTVAENAQLNLPEGNGAIGNNTNANSTQVTILEAYYGAQGRRNNVIGLLNSAMRNDRVNLRVNNASMGGDPYPGPDKELYVRYSYRGREYESTTREGLFVTLPNDNDRPVGNSSGTFPSGTGGIFGSNPNTGFYIESATWGSGNRTVDVSRELQNMIRDNRLSVRAANATFTSNDPAVGTEKELIVRYRDASGRSQTARIREGGSLNIP